MKTETLNHTKQTSNYVIVAAKWLLAVPFIIFGFNKFLLFANVPPPAGETAQAFLGTMFSSYLAALVGIIEIVGGMLLLITRTSFIGLLLLAPVVLNIVLFHVAHDFIGNGIWVFSLVTFIIVAFFQKANFNKLLQIQ